MKTVVFAGTFDPFTAGHLEITEKAALLFDKVVVAVAKKKQKRRVCRKKSGNSKIERFRYKKRKCGNF